MKSQGLKIKTIDGQEFEVSGKVTSKNTLDGKVYYCRGESFPESIVTEIKKSPRDGNLESDKHKHSTRL